MREDALRWLHNAKKHDNVIRNCLHFPVYCLSGVLLSCYLTLKVGSYLVSYTVVVVVATVIVAQRQFGVARRSDGSPYQRAIFACTILFYDTMVTACCVPRSIYQYSSIIGWDRLENMM